MSEERRRSKRKQMRVNAAASASSVAGSGSTSVLIRPLQLLQSAAGTADNEGQAVAEAIRQLIRVLMSIIDDVLVFISSGGESTSAFASAIHNLIAVKN